MNYDKPLTPMAMQRRDKKKNEERIQQNKEFRNNQMKIPQNQFNQSRLAGEDFYMKDALAKVRQSDVSIPHDLARFHGSTIYNKPDKG